MVAESLTPADLRHSRLVTMLEVSTGTAGASVVKPTKAPAAALARIQTGEKHDRCQDEASDEALHDVAPVRKSLWCKAFNT